MLLVIGVFLVVTGIAMGVGWVISGPIRTSTWQP